MTAPDPPASPDLPIGRRVAQLRTRLGITQQVLADRLGRSKSWVEKVERGVRTLDRLSVIEAVAAVLGVDPEVLLPRQTHRVPITGLTAAIDRVRAALACYPTPTDEPPQPPSPPAHLDRRLQHAWAAYRHAHHPQVMRLLPDLLTDIRHAETTAGTEHTADLLVRVYRLATQTLVKLDAADLAWLAADRAMAATGGDPRRTAIAAIPLAQALRALDRGRLAMAATITAAHRLLPTPSRATPPHDLALAGTLLTEAAIAAATCADATAARDLAHRAARLGTALGDHPRPDDGDLGFGPTTVDLARALIATELGNSQQAISTHQHATTGAGWPRLSAEHRAAHLIDIVRAHLDAGDPQAAGRALVIADRIAPAETRTRPAARAALTAVLRTGPAPADVTRLAATIGLTLA
ncbi:helix-turn-helix domain-containing protein [Plantactinospora sp. WMMB334]|uniref:helix-turn-helix domain-containing protein n=1 Tax=Plantactinospora sp. WMMB334 TaxID=3404119 RepID=UPI003B92E886